MTDLSKHPYAEFQPSRHWGAHWIWAAGDGLEKNAYYYFRRCVNLKQVPAEVTLFITADTRYLLMINGQRVGRGAPQSKPYYHYYDEHRVEAYLKPGDNCIAIICNHLGTLVDTRGGLLAELVDRRGETLAATDSTWRVAPANAWQRNTYCEPGNKMTPYQEFFDARQVPAGWDAPGFDDATWVPATVIDTPPSYAKCPFSRLVPRDIPQMAETPLRPVRIQRVEESTDLAARKHMDNVAISLSVVGGPLKHTRVENPEALCTGTGATVVQGSTSHVGQTYCEARYTPALVLDFGRIVTAFTDIEIEAAAGTALEIGYAERLVDGYVNLALEYPFADRYTAKDGRQSFRSFSWRAFRYMKIRVRNCDKPLQIHSLRAIETTYPYEELGGFESNDQTLNDVFRISKATVRLCSNECLMDTPYREQAQWLGDVALVTLPAIYACFGDTRLPEKFLRQAAGNQLPTGLLSSISNSISHGWTYAIPDYSLWWVIALWKHYLYTGDAHWINRYYPTAQIITNAVMPHMNERGLVENMPHWVLLDWAPLDRRGECTGFNAIFYGALEALQNMARLKNDAYTLELTRSTMHRMRSVFQQRLFDPARGCFADARVNGEFSTVVSEHANYAAIRWGLCDEATAKLIIDRLTEHPALSGVIEAQPFFMPIMLEALDQSGRFDLALALTRERWGQRMVALGATSTYEEWSCNGSWRSGDFTGFQRTQSHAWSACPASFLVGDLIGLKILEPGCRKVALAPHVTPFDYTVAYPTPRGIIRVRCTRGELSLDVPATIEVTA